jgi:glycosyltransferase involved in cell wall biosynthesis
VISILASASPWLAKSSLVPERARTAATELLARSTLEALKAGEQPRDLDSVVATVLAAADRAQARGDRETANQLLNRAALLLFDRTRHLDGAESPLAANPEFFLAPLRASPAWQAVTAPRGRRENGAANHSGPLKVVAVTDSDQRFLDAAIDAANSADSNLTIRVLNLAQWAERNNLTLPLNPGQQIAARSVSSNNQPWATALTDELADADVVWVDWSQRAAVLVSLLDLAARRVIVRLHSFEAFTVFPQLIDPSRIDAFVVVSPAFKNLMARTVPNLAGADRDVHVIGNPLAEFAAHPKSAAAPFTLGMVGWAAPAKDAVWTLDLLAALRADDDRWQLHLIGAEPDDSAYGQAVRQRMARPDVADAVTVVGQTDDVPGALADVGVIVSSSTRESFHLGLAEGVASGALPVVRNWPLLAPYGGAHGLWPDEWIVESIDEAVARITNPPVGNAANSLPSNESIGRDIASVLRGN